MVKGQGHSPSDILRKMDASTTARHGVLSCSVSIVVARNEGQDSVGELA